MSNIIVKLHVNADYDPQIGLRGFEGLLAEDGNIQYVVDEYTQITLPNYNTVYKSGYILVGWCEKNESERVNGVDPIYTYYYEPVDDCDLYPVWVSSNISIKQATITPIMSTVTTVTAIGNLSEDERQYAQAAIDAFNTMVDDQVTTSAEAIIRDEVGPIAERVARDVVQEEFNTWSDGITTRLSDVEVRLGTLERDSNNHGTQISALSAQYDGQETRLDGIDDEIEEINSNIGGFNEDITTMQGTIDEINGKVNTNAADIITLGQTVEGQGNTINGLNGSVSDINSRVTTLEDASNNHGIQIGSLIGSIERLEADTQLNKDNITALEDASNNHGIQIGSLIGTIERLEADTRTNANNITALGQTVEGQGNTINGLNGSVSDINSRVTTLEDASNNHGIQIGSLIGSIERLEADTQLNKDNITALGQTVENQGITINGLNDSVSDINSRVTTINSNITTLNRSVSDITAQISTQAIQEKAGTTASDIAYKMANTVVFRLDGNQKTEVACTLSSQYDYKRVKTLSDYKSSSDYNFGTDVVWYNNGVVMSDLDPITSGSVLIGIEPVDSPEIYALPVVSIEDKLFSVGPEEEKAATNYGVTSVFLEEDMVFDSSKSYNSCVTISTLKQIVTLKADALSGCKFDGWYSVSTQENGTVVPEYIISEEQVVQLEAIENAQYAALFEGDPEEDFYTPVRYMPSESPWGYCILYHANGSTFDEDYNLGDFTTDLTKWTPMGSYTTFTAEEVGGENDSLLIAVRMEEGLHGAYKQPGTQTVHYIVEDIGSEGTGVEVVTAVKRMFGDEWNVFGVHKEENIPGESIIVKITYDNE